ncbi:MAG: hypothetical protein EPN94_06200 [Nitrospirae bacterium]|nr:MAG: hypothetical protein EPN94_06200 [Nitrospirota bacterium]
MDTDALGPEAGPLMRAKLHIRGGKRRLRQGKISAGILTLYDALGAAMEWHIASPERRSRLQVLKGENLNDEKIIFKVLVRSGVLDNSFDYQEFDRLVERAADEDMTGYDYRELLKGIESVMTRLGVMPFDEGELPPEDPSTF